MELLGILVSQGDFPSPKEIDRLLKRGNKEGVDQAEYESELGAIRDKMVLVEPAYDFWDDELLEAIDDIAVDQLQDVEKIIGIYEPEYVNALSQYAKEVIKTIQEFHPDNVLTPKVVARFKFAMNDTEALPIALPLITDFVFEALALSFKTTPYAFDAVSTRSIIYVLDTMAR